MTVDFKGRAVIVTGAGNGLGRAHAHELARLGADVVVNDLGGSPDGVGGSSRAADFVVDEIRSAGGSAVPNYDSVATDEGCRGIAATALEAFGRIDAVVHNAGILRNASFGEMTDDKLFPVLETHLFGSIYLSRAVWPTMVQQGYGRLVFTSSSTGVFGRINGANYASAKAGIVGLCNVLALEGEELGILANAVMPVATTRLGGAPDITDDSDEAKAKRAEAVATRPRAQPEWVAPMVAYLASEACTTTHRYYSSAAGRYARIFIGVSTGWYAPERADDTEQAVCYASSQS
ncbi:MAG: SDR family NAD(P)-dependent oxidoreductase [Acidobacteria bacterium]|nr:SDR family NAD(P)-dependent oxidoreductase [Acidobacteriota bacterium]